jgi:transcription antitermination factor NusG
MNPMPLLKKELSIQPADLFSIPSERLPWRVAHVRSRTEKVLARHLTAAGIPFFLPQTERVTYRRARRSTSHLPLFAGYVFYRGGVAEDKVAYRSASVATLLEVPDQKRLHDELHQIHRLISAGATLIPVEKIVTGDSVRVVAGSFAGYRGIVIEERGSERLLVELSMLRKQVLVEFPREVVATDR